MKKPASSELKRGQSISFRIPSDTPDYLLKELQRLKTTERRNFSSKVAEIVLAGVNQNKSNEREAITIPLPKHLTKVQKDWLKHEHSEALLGSIVYQLISDPLRATALLASLNSGSANIDEALYLQEESGVTPVDEWQETAAAEEPADDATFEDELDSFDWNQAKKNEPETHKEEAEEEDIDDLLGGFLSHMNK
ncbi:hypothetical protein MKX67_22390 [Cytobacillus sp. FSL W7-1323]|uniref:Uncharacterized protein n=1 Tax=Cytobacillus kochii TaxID=859143 RepID=A0A248TI52_9BACI|nr:MULTISPECIES: hypothetical protein [Cytobacillus]ASV67894.1 hypothetical protein CKF48_11585 [Cytobacillus kochii]MEA1853846.1 hypothetical protein [Cytobacillus sp. OWB-43]MED1605189.1 hypothetical protein [Cytobacillus kochii]